MTACLHTRTRALVTATAAVLALLAAALLMPGRAAATARACRFQAALPDLGYGGEAAGMHGPSTVVGSVFDSTGRAHPALWRAGRLIKVWRRIDGFAGGVNARGDVVITTGDNSQAYAFADGALHPLAPVAGSFHYARRINGRGQIAGTAFDGQYAARWDSYAAAPVRLLPAPGDTASFAKGINDEGTVAGDSDESDGTPHPATWDMSGAITLLSSGFGPDQAGDLFNINDAGQSAGESWQVDRAAQQILAIQATAWSPAGRPTLIPLLPATNESSAYGLNNRGWVVGVSVSDFDYSTGAGGPGHGFVWFGDGAPVALPVPGHGYDGSQSLAHDVDDRGTVVGSSGPAAGPALATVWTCD